MPAGGSLHPPSIETVTGRQHFLKQNGKVVFKFAVSQMVESVQVVLERNGLTPADVALLVPHQANQRILDAVGERLGLPSERVASVLAGYGNTTGATLPLALDAAVRDGKLKRGDLVVFAAVGAGFTSGATLVRWA
jgi:3-oxoacyl-[acyl-carrier-protein] synthase-3